MIEMRVDTREIERRLNRLAGTQLPFAVALGINDTATIVKADEQAQLERDLDRPTPFTKKGMFIARANKRRLSGVVGFKRIQSEYLGVQARGGKRRPKKRAVVVPVGQRRNKYGNMPRGALKRALAKPNVFSGKVKGTAGIWQRPDRGRRYDGTYGTKRRNGLKLLAIYQDRVSYRARFDFYDRARTTAGREIGPAIARNLRRAVKTAR